MGFRLNMGATSSCRIHDGYIEVDWPIQFKCKTSLRVETDWQCNTFKSPWVYFVLWDGKYVYVGLRDGCVNVMGKDGLLRAVFTWDPPIYTPVDVGYYKVENGGMYIARSIIEEPRLIFIRGQYRTFVLNEGLTAITYDPRTTTFDARDARNLQSIQEEYFGLGCMLMGGEMLDEEKHGHWEVEPFDSTHNLIWF